MYLRLTNLELKIVREPDAKPGRKHAYVEKVPKLTERLYSDGFAVDDYETILCDHGINVSHLGPSVSHYPSIDEMDAQTALSLLTALVKKEENVEGNFLATCVRSGLIDEILGRLETIDWENRELPKWIMEATNNALTDLENFPWNEEITPYAAIAPYLEYTDKDGNTRVRGLSNSDEFAIVDAFHRQAKNHGLYLDSTAYQNMRIGLPINIPFRVCKVGVGSDGPEVLMSFSITDPHWNNVSFSLLRFADCLEAEYYPIERRMDNRVNIKPTPGQLKILKDCLDSINVQNWSADYVAPVFDGWSWTLQINTNNLNVESHGSNAYPDNFEKLVCCIADTFGFEDFTRIFE